MGRRTQLSARALRLEQRQQQNEEQELLAIKKAKKSSLNDKKNPKKRRCIINTIVPVQINEAEIKDQAISEPTVMESVVPIMQSVDLEFKEPFIEAVLIVTDCDIKEQINIQTDVPAVTLVSEQEVALVSEEKINVVTNVPALEDHVQVVRTNFRIANFREPMERKTYDQDDDDLIITGVGFDVDNMMDSTRDAHYFQECLTK